MNRSADAIRAVAKRPAWRRRVLPAFAVLISLLIFAAPARAAAAKSEPVTVEASMPERGYVGDAVPLMIVVEGTNQASSPDWPRIDGVGISYLRSEDRSSSFTLSVNGQTTTRRNTTVVLIHEAVFHRTGVFEIPPVEVPVGSGSSARTLRTEPLRITIEDPAQDPTFSLEIAVDSTEVYAGQPVSILADWVISKPVRNVRISMPYDHSSANVMPGARSASARQELAKRQPSARGEPRFFETSVNGEPIVARVEDRSLGGRQQQALSFDLVVIPQRNGEIELGPIRVDYDAVIGQRPRRFTDAPWDDLSLLQRQATISAPITLRVAPLPTEGRPANFSGLVGAYSIHAGAQPTTAGVGEPIELRVLVRGPHPLTLVPPLDLADAVRSSDDRLRLPSDPLLPSVDENGAMFETRVRARSDSLGEIPPIGLSYFDPTSGRYQTAWTDAIPLEIRPGTTIGLPEDEQNALAQSGGSDEAADATPRLPDGLEDVQREVDGGSAAVDRALALLPDSRVGRLALAGALPAAYLSAWSIAGLAAVRRQSRHPSTRRRVARARRIAGRRLRVNRGALSPTEAGAIIREFIARSAGYDYRTLTAHEAAGLLPTWIEPSLQGRLISRLKDAEVRFAKGGDSARDQTDPLQVADDLNQLARAWAKGPIETRRAG